MSVGAQYWRTRFAFWPVSTSRQLREDGYTVLVPVPGDLPVFLELALAVLATQASEHRVATIVVPDLMTPEIRAIVARRRRSWTGPLELVELPRPERWLLPKMKNGHRNHGVQLVTGVSASRSSHIVLHDADLFLLTPEVLDRQYEMCRERGLACLGVSPVWDEWYEAHGRHLAATWELCSRVEWMRSFPPYLHMAHDAQLWGEEHAFDTMLHPQALSEPDSIAVNDVGASIVHFNYVITTFRQFQRQGAGMLDDQFRVLLIRVFIDLFAPDTATDDVPTLSELARGLGSQSAHVRYPDRESAAEDYARFRGHLEGALAGPWTLDARGSSTRAALAAFDDFYGWAPAAASH